MFITLSARLTDSENDHLPDSPRSYMDCGLFIAVEVSGRNFFINKVLIIKSIDGSHRGTIREKVV